VSTRVREAPEPIADEAPAKRRRPVAAGVLTGAAAVLLFVGLVVPNRLSDFGPGAFLRIPVEALVLAALVLALPGRAGRIVAAVAGAVLGVLTLVKITDMGFYAILNRPFDPVFDRVLFKDGYDWLVSSFGKPGAIGTLVLAVLLIVGIPTLMGLASVRLTTVVRRHPVPATRAVAALTVAWVALAGLGVPAAGDGAARLAWDNGALVKGALDDKGAFARQVKVDRFAATPANELLTGLRGKDFLLTVVESYGRYAVQDAQVDAVLDDGTRQLESAGFAARSGFLTSPVFGAGSWLAHGTFLSGLKVNNQQRYGTLVDSDRLTLTKAFQEAGWRTVAVMPGTTQPWSEGTFYGLDQVYDFQHLGYKGSNFGWATMPDQYTFKTFQQDEYGKADRGPLMAEIVTVSSHAPWEPLPKFLPWDQVGDGSVYNGMGARLDAPQAIFNMDVGQVRANYLESIRYSLTTIVSYLKNYGTGNTVLLFFGDHQPAPLVTGAHATHDVPVTIVAKDPRVLDRIAGWDWTSGLRPAAGAPVWPMEAFRDRFLTAYGPQGDPRH
jgi:hypothetical protein